MVKIIFLAIIITALCGLCGSSINIECSYDSPVYSIVNEIYRCFVNKDPNILTEESTEISGINETHENNKSNDDVLGFEVVDKTIQFFPKGLDKFFKNLKLIWMSTCKLKEIHQSDLKVFPDLVYFYLSSNEIEVIEEGLFDFNPDLELVGFDETELVHIDPNVFDHLTKLRYFWFEKVYCVNQDVFNSDEKVQEAIKIVKSNCSNSEFLFLDSQIKNLEIESKTLNPEAFSSKLESFEKSFNNSKFSKFRPFNYKLTILKFPLNVLTKNDSKLINDLHEDLKVSLCEPKSPLTELKASQDSLQTTLNSIKLSTDDQGSKLDQIQKSQNQLQGNMSSSINNAFVKVSDIMSSISQIEIKVSNLKSCPISSINALGSTMSKLDSTQQDHGAVLSYIQNSQKKAVDAIDGLRSSQNDTMLTIKDLKLSQDSSLSNLTSKFNDLKKDIKSTQDDTKLSISDIVATLSDHTKFQSEAKDSFVKIRTVQNEIKKSLNDLSINRNEDSTINDKVDSLEGHFVDFKAENSDKLAQIEKELTKKLHKLSTNFDEKVKGIEKRLMKKFEEILEEKFEKYLTQKFG